MTDQARTVDPYSLTAEQATTKLADMTKAYNATKKSDDPISDRYADNKGRLDRLFNGDAKERGHFEEALKAKIEADPTEAAFTGEIGEVPSSELRHQSELASYLKSQGHPEEVVREALTTKDAPISQELHNQLKTWKAKALTNEDWTKAYLAGSVEHRLQMESAIIALMHPIAEDVA